VKRGCCEAIVSLLLPEGCFLASYTGADEYGSCTTMLTPLKTLTSLNSNLQRRTLNNPHGRRNQAHSMPIPAASSHPGLPLSGGNPGTDLGVQERPSSVQPLYDLPVEVKSQSEVRLNGKDSTPAPRNFNIPFKCW
jgi:hypothetical protein